MPALYLTRFACGGLGKLSRALAVDAGASDGDGLSHCRIILPSGNFKRYSRPWLLTRLFRTDQAACPLDALPLALLIPGHVVGIACGSRAAHSFGNHLHNGGAFSCREIKNGKFLPHTVPKVDAMRGLFVCDVSFNDAAKIGDVPVEAEFAIDADILDEDCTPMHVISALAPSCILFEFPRLPLNIHYEGPYIGVVQSAL